MRPHISQIEGSEAKGNWWPNIPLIDIAAVTAGVTNDITTIGVVRQNGLKPLQFLCPVDITRVDGVNLKEGIYYITNQLDNPLQFDLREKDTTYAYSYIVYYNFRTDTVGVEMGAADGTLAVPTLPANCMLIGTKIEPKQGDAYTPTVTESPLILSKTFVELTNLAANNLLVAGQLYRMTDYATTHEINDSANTGTTRIWTEATEPLIMLGISNNAFAPEVWSEQYPKDIIKYDISNVLCEDGTTARPGIITYRKDEWENETHFDFRGTKVYDGANDVYIFANSRNPGSASYSGNKIGASDNYNNYFLFAANCYSNIVREACSNNALGVNCYSNHFGYNCYDNTLNNSSYSNLFKDSCSGNILGTGCDSNYFGVNCSNIELNNGALNNIFGDNCSNIVPDTGNTSAILNTTFESGVSNITYEATATHLYATYHKVVFMYPDGTVKLRYYDNAGALQVVDVND